jgi:hypothetical protein
MSDRLANYTTLEESSFRAPIMSAFAGWTDKSEADWLSIAFAYRLVTDYFNGYRTF